MPEAADQHEDAVAAHAPAERAHAHEQRPLSSAADWVASLAAMTRAGAVPYGFTLVISGTVLILVHDRGVPEIAQVFAFALGAVAGFALPAALARRYAPAVSPAHLDEHLVSAGIANAFAVCVCLGESVGLAKLDRWLAWPLAGAVVVTSYFMIVALQHSLSRRRDAGL